MAGGRVSSAESESQPPVSKNLFLRDGKVYLPDLGSTNSILLNENEITSSVLSSGDLFDVGGIRFRFETNRNFNAMFTLFTRFKKFMACKTRGVGQSRALFVHKESHPGDREQNQDASDFVVGENNGFFIVADGMGGHRGGQLASRYFTEALKNFYSSQTLPVRNPDQALKEMISHARTEMCRRLKDEAPELSPHTTCVCALLQENQLWAVHVGDSRLYVIEKDKIIWQTHDHSIAQLMVDEGELDRDEVANDNSQNMLYRSIGCDKPHEVSIKHFQAVQPDSSLLLCSDGFWQYIRAEEIIQLSLAVEPQTAIRQSVENAYRRANGNADNITAMLVRIS